MDFKNYKHTVCCPYGRLECGHHNDCSNNGVTSRYSVLELWEEGTPNEIIKEYCEGSIDKAIVYESSVCSLRNFLPQGIELNHKMIESYYEGQLAKELHTLLSKQLRVAHIKDSTHAEVVFKEERGLYMASGNFVLGEYGYKGVFHEIAGAPMLSVHDRCEAGRNIFD